ncbi:Rv3235 family protein [Streptomyces sp. NPDC006602]|uniref:Rv3235 family protein n=1 Tax=Streptomyces sp. NPDC006602 TaxID=3364751 RepID=UPI0036C08B27
MRSTTPYKIPNQEVTARYHAGRSNGDTMHKVMTRANPHPGTRPPGRRDPRRPGGTPPRTPGGGTPRTTTPDGRPPGSPSTGGTPTRTSPPDNRPPTTPATATRTTGRTTPPGRPTTAGKPTTATGSPTTAERPRPATAPRRPWNPPGRPGTAPGAGTSAAVSPFAPGTRTTAPTAPTTPCKPAPASRAAPATAPVVAPSQISRRPLPIPQPRLTDVFADRLLAVLSGRRPVHFMLRYTAGRAYDELAWLAERGPLRTRGVLPVVRDIGYFEPRPGAIEAFARIGAGDRLRAMAFRLEQGRDLRWRCTAVEVGGPRRPHTDDDTD